MATNNLGFLFQSKLQSIRVYNLNSVYLAINFHQARKSLYNFSYTLISSFGNNEENTAKFRRTYQIMTQLLKAFVRLLEWWP